MRSRFAEAPLVDDTEADQLEEFGHVLQRPARQQLERRLRAVKVSLDGHAVMTVAEGNGPVNALDSALRKALVPIYPTLDEVKLVDYKVRILTPQEGTKAVTRVKIRTL